MWAPSAKTVASVWRSDFQLGGKRSQLIAGPLCLELRTGSAHLAPSQSLPVQLAGAFVVYTAALTQPLVVYRRSPLHRETVRKDPSLPSERPDSGPPSTEQPVPDLPFPEPPVITRKGPIAGHRAPRVRPAGH